MYKPEYEITDEMLNKVSEIEYLRSRISNSVILPEQEIEMRYRMTDVKNYRKALDFVCKRKTKKKPIGLTDILSVHKILMEGLLPKEKIGCLRTNDVHIADQDDNTIYSEPESRILVRELGELLYWLENDAKNIHPLIASGVFHYHFISIHPFADGNDRCTRILTMLYLGLRNYDFRSLLVLDSYYESDKRKYYDALQLANNYDGRKSAVLSPWLTYYIDGILSSAKVLMNEVLLLSVVIKDPQKIKRLGKDEADLLGYAKQFGSISLSEAMDILPDVPRRTVQRRLKALIDGGYLQLTGSTTTARYVFSHTNTG